MTVNTRPAEYHRVAKLLHWLIAMLILAQFVGGKFMTHLGLETDQKYLVYQLHKSFGFIVLGLSLYRLYWRMTHPVPSLPDGMPSLEKKIAPLTHWLFYGFMIFVPFSGWLYVSAQSGIETKLFFLLPIFHWPVPETELLRSLLDNTHSALATAMIGLLVLHVAAALKHHYISKDDTFIRMLPRQSVTGRMAVPAITAGLVGVAALYLTVILVWGEDDHYKEEIVTNEEVALRSSDNDKVTTRLQGEHLWDINPSATYVELEGSAFGAQKSVRIEDVQVMIALDPEAPEEHGEIGAILNMASLTADDGMTDNELKGSGWFNIESFPTVMFHADRITGSNGAYVAEGMLTIREISKPLSLPFVLVEEDGLGKAHGEITINRHDFGLGGEGDTVSPNVTVTVRVEARRAN